MTVFSENHYICIVCEYRMRLDKVKINFSFALDFHYICS